MIKNYFKIALRNLWKNRTFSAINIAGLSIGITCSLIIFMIVQYELSFDTFHQHPDRVYRFVTDVRLEKSTDYNPGTPLPLAEAVKVDFPQIKQVASVYGSANNQIDILDERGVADNKRFKENEGVFYVNAAFFEMFSFKWVQGDPASVLSKPNTVALTKETAEKYFGSWQNAIGKSIKKDNNELLQVAGILENPPANTDFSLKLVVSWPTFINSDFYKQRGKSWGSVSGRTQCYILLPPNVSIAQINAGLPAFRKKHVSAKSSDYYALQPLSDIHFNDRYGTFASRTIARETLWSLVLIGAFLLLLACINFINLSTAQAAKRSKEVGIRKVLGSQRWQLAIQFLGETFLIVLMATLLSVALVILLSPLAKEVLNRSISLYSLQSTFVIAVIGIVLAGITILSGFYPAIIISGFRPIEALKNKISAHVLKGISLRRFLVTTQFVIAQVLMIGTLIVISQISFFRNTSLGFDHEAIVTVPLPRDSISITKWESFRQALLQEPGIQKISFSSAAPAGRSVSYSSFRFNQNVKDENFEISTKLADANYLSTYNLQLLAGRFYEPSDTLREVVVNETLLKKAGVINPQDALGKYLVLANRQIPIVGVVKDFHSSSLRDPMDAIVISAAKTTYRLAGIKLQTAAGPQALESIKKTFNSFFPNYVFEQQFLDETIANFYDQEQRLSNVFKIFAAIGIFISCMGLYGLVLFTSVQRTKEIGIRKVLGAGVPGIAKMLSKDLILLVLIAFIIAAPLAWWLMSEWLKDFAYRVDISWWMFVAAGTASVLIALITVSFQAIKAALANPVKSLRTE